MNDSVLVVEGYAARLNVERGHLIVTDGFTVDDRREIHFPRGRCSIERMERRSTGTCSSQRRCRGASGH